MIIEWDEPPKEPLAEKLRDHIADVVRRMYDDLRGHTGRDHNLLARQFDDLVSRVATLEHDRDILMRRLAALERDRQR